MTTVGCVVSRMKSTRLPRKALADVHGESLTRRLLRRLSAARSLDAIVLCTSTHPDDRVLLELAREMGIDGFAGNEDDVLSRLIAVGEEAGADHIVRITGDNVLTCPELLDVMVRESLQTDAEYGRVVELPLGVTAELLTLELCKRLHREMDPQQSEYLMLYAFDPSHHRCCVVDPGPALRRPNFSLTVDTPRDLELVRRIWAECSPQPEGPALREVIPLLDRMDPTPSIADDAPIRLPRGESTTYGALLEMLRERTERAVVRPLSSGVQNSSRSPST